MVYNTQQPLSATLPEQYTYDLTGTFWCDNGLFTAFLDWNGDTYWIYAISSNVNGEVLSTSANSEIPDLDGFWGLVQDNN